MERMNHACVDAHVENTHDEQVLSVAQGAVLRMEVTMRRDILKPLGERQGEFA